MKRTFRIIKHIKEAALSVLYPAKCPFCGSLTGSKQIKACRECSQKLPFIKGARCYKCGKPVVGEETEYCMDCTKKTHYFTQGIALWSYDVSVKKAVYDFKYRNQRAFAEYFAKELIKNYYHQIKAWDADVIIPVPIHRSRYRQRGFNQAELIANELSGYIKIPVLPDYVHRIKNTKPQKELNDKERQKNLKNAFKINKNGVELKKVIIIDDIYTTGTTVDVVAELLLHTGINDVYVITLCIGKGY